MTGQRAEASRRPLLTGALLFVFACAVRFAYLASIANEPAVRYPVLDAHAYHEWALAIVAGEWRGERVYYQDPLYPFFLAGLYRIFGAGSLAVLFAQAILDAASVVLLYATARRLFDSSTALLAGVLASTYAVYLYYDALLLKAPLLVFLFTLSLYLLVRAAQRSSLGAWLGFGIAFGFAVLTRANALLFLPALAAWIGLDREQPLARRLVIVSVATLGVLAALLPVALRNYAVGGDLVLLNSQGGQNFYIGNFRGNDSGAYRAPPFLRACPQHEEEDFERVAVAAVGRPLSPSAVSRYWLSRGLAEIAADPVHFARHLLRKLVVLVNRYEVPDNYSYAFFAEEIVPALAWPLPSWGLLLPLACCGAWFSRGRRDTRLLLLFGASYALGLLIFFNLSRLRLPLVPLLLLFSAFGMTELARRLRARDWRTGVAALVGLAIAYPVVQADVGGERPAIRYYNLAQAQQARGRAHRDQAAELSAGGDERAAAVELVHADRERDLAEQAYREGLARDPHNRRLAIGLRMLLEVRTIELERLGHDREALAKARALSEIAPEYAKGHARRGALHAALGERDAAREAFHRALSIDPENRKARHGILKLDFTRDARDAPGADATAAEPGT